MEVPIILGILAALYAIDWIIEKAVKILKELV